MPPSKRKTYRMARSGGYLTLEPISSPCGNQQPPDMQDMLDTIVVSAQVLQEGRTQRGHKFRSITKAQLKGQELSSAAALISPMEGPSSGHHVNQPSIIAETFAMCDGPVSSRTRSRTCKHVSVPMSDNNGVENEPAVGAPSRRKGKRRAQDSLEEDEAPRNKRKQRRLDPGNLLEEGSSSGHSTSSPPQRRKILQPKSTRKGKGIARAGNPSAEAISPQQSDSDQIFDAEPAPTFSLSENQRQNQSPPSAAVVSEPEISPQPNEMRNQDEQPSTPVVHNQVFAERGHPEYLQHEQAVADSHSPHIIDPDDTEDDEMLDILAADEPPVIHAHTPGPVHIYLTRLDFYHIGLREDTPEGDEYDYFTEAGLVEEPEDLEQTNAAWERIGVGEFAEFMEERFPLVPLMRWGGAGREFDLR